PDVGERAAARRRGAEEAEGPDGVVPDGRHRLRARARDADVIRDGDVEAAGSVAGLRDAQELGGSGPRLPRLREDRALRRDRKLEAPDEPARRDDRDRGGAPHAAGVKATGIRLIAGAFQKSPSFLGVSSVLTPLSSSLIPLCTRPTPCVSCEAIGRSLVDWLEPFRIHVGGDGDGPMPKLPADVKQPPPGQLQGARWRRYDEGNG